MHCYRIGLQFFLRFSSGNERFEVGKSILDEYTASPGTISYFISSLRESCEGESDFKGLFSDDELKGLEAMLADKISKFFEVRENVISSRALTIFYSWSRVYDKDEALKALKKQLQDSATIAAFGCLFVGVVQSQSLGSYSVKSSHRFDSKEFHNFVSVEDLEKQKNDLLAVDLPGIEEGKRECFREYIASLGKSQPGSTEEIPN